MDKYLYLDKYIIVNKYNAKKLLTSGLKRVNNIIGTKKSLYKYINNVSYRIEINKIYNILISSYYLISERKIIYKDYAKRILDTSISKRIDHIIGTHDELIEYVSNSRIYDEIYQKIVYKYIEKRININIASSGNDEELKLKEINILDRIKYAIISRNSIYVNELVERWEILNKMYGSDGFNIYRYVLKIASKNNNIDIVRNMLILNGNNNYKCEIFNATRSGNLDIIKLITKYDISDNNDQILYGASREGNLELFGEIIKIQFSTKIYTKALKFASIGGHKHIADSLIQYGGKITSETFKKIILRGNSHYLKYIISYMIKNRISGPRLVSSYYLAAESGYEDIFHIIRSYNEPINNKALYSAVKGGNMNIIKYVKDKLIRNGLSNFNDKTLLESSVLSGNLEAVRFFIKRNISLNMSLKIAAENGYIDIVKFLVSMGAKSYDSSMISASRNGHINIIILLINLGARKMSDIKHGSSNNGFVELSRHLSLYQ
jgi:ankyrin repeat protein